LSDLDRAREYLFPNLSEAEGRARIERALADAADQERVDRIEALANKPDLFPHLLDALRRLIEEQQARDGEDDEEEEA
jgi:hypothetical protein